MNACQSYRFGSLVCADGFPVKPYCSGNVGCPTCGHISEQAIPLCLREEAPPHLFDESGRPILTLKEPS